MAGAAGHVTKILGPVFSQAPYNVIRYAMAPDVDDTITEYFEVDPDTGIIFLQKSLRLDREGTKEYGVSVHCVCVCVKLSVCVCEIDNY